MFNLMRPWFYISTECQADLWPFIQGHYLNIFFSEITGLFDRLIRLFRSLDQNGCSPNIWENKICFIISCSWPWPIWTLLKRSGERFRTFRSSSLVNHWMYFDLDTLLGGGKEYIGFRWLWPYFQGHTGTLECLKLGFRAFLLNQGMDFDQTCIDDLIFKFTRALWNVQNRVYVCYLLYQWMYFNQSCLDIVGSRGRVDEILVTLALFSRSYRHFEMS